MYGATMGDLLVEIFDGTSWTTLLSVSGDQGNSWKTVNTTSAPLQEILFYCALPALRGTITKVMSRLITLLLKIR